MRALVAILVCLTAGPVLAGRYSGAAGLSPTITAHSGRYAVTAELRPARNSASGSRFALRAQLASKSSSAVCGPVTPTIFANGFE